MGLDMYIFKRTPEYEVLKAEKRELVKQFDISMLKVWDQYEDNVRVAVKQFILRNKKFIPGETHQDSQDRLMMEAKRFIINTPESEIAWNLFNNFSIFTFYPHALELSTTKVKFFDAIDRAILDKVGNDGGLTWEFDFEAMSTNTLISVSKSVLLEQWCDVLRKIISPDLEIIATFKKIQNMISKIEAEEEDVAYWRKNWELQDYMEEHLFRVENCEENVLSLETLEKIRDYVRGQEEEFAKEWADEGGGNYQPDTQVQEIIDTYDPTATYIYFPSW